MKMDSKWKKCWIWLLSWINQTVFFRERWGSLRDHTAQAACDLVARRAYCVETFQNRCVFVRSFVRPHHFWSLSEQPKWSHLRDLIQKGDQKGSRDVKSVSHPIWDLKESDYHRNGVCCVTDHKLNVSEHLSQCPSGDPALQVQSSYYCYSIL